MNSFAHALVLLGAVAAALNGQTVTTLFSFDGTNGSAPFAPLVQGTDGDLYGTTSTGGANGYGTIFKITTGGALRTVYNFCSQPNCADGANPYAGLIQTTNGDFFGTTFGGGALSSGTIFKITPGGTLTVLHSFTGGDGDNPYAGLVQATNGDFYGTTFSGLGPSPGGTVFKITPNGTLTTLYGFCLGGPPCADGEQIWAGLVQATNGDLYGTTFQGSTYGGGTIFRITPAGTLTTLYIFGSQPDDGGEHYSTLIQAANGYLYGTTYVGGAGGLGSIFKVTPSGKLTTIYSFCNQTGCAPGHPYAGLVQATDGNLYGTTQGVGSGCAIFRITPTGTLSALASQCGSGGRPDASLTQATNGILYGTTLEGGTCGGPYGCGTIFSLDVGLGPFVKPQPTSAKIGAIVDILGTNLTGATSVTFNGTPATFKVASASLITTTVPTGATAGKIQVVTPSGTLSSNVPFRVLK